MPQNGNDTFDYAAAKKAGYSDSEIQGYLHQNYGFDFDITSAKKSGYSDNEINGYLSQQNLKKKVGGTGNGINVNTQSLSTSQNGFQNLKTAISKVNLQPQTSNSNLGVDTGMKPVDTQAIKDQEAKTLKQAAINTAHQYFINNKALLESLAKTNPKLIAKDQDGKDIDGEFNDVQLEKTSAFQKKLAEITDAQKNGTLALTHFQKGKNTGQPVLTKSDGFLGSLGGSIANSFKSTKDAIAGMFKNPSELADYYDKQREDLPEVPESAPTGIGSMVGNMVGGIIKPAAEFAIGEAIQPGGGGLVTAAADIIPTSTSQKTKQLYYERMDALEKQYGAGNVPKEQRLDAINKAMSNALIQAIPEEAMQLYLFGKGTGSIANDAAIKSFGKTLTKAGIDVEKMYALGGSSEALTQGIKSEQGYDTKNADKEIGDAALNWGLMEAAFKILPVVGASKYLKSSAKEALTTAPPEVLGKLSEEAVQKGWVTQEQADNIQQDLEQYQKIKNTLPKNISPEKSAAVTGLLQKNENLEAEKKTLNPIAHDDIDAEIDNNEVKAKQILNSNSPLKHETDQLTGQRAQDVGGRPAKEEIKAQTEIPIEKGNEGSNTSNELVGSNEESQTEKNVGEDLQSQQKEVKLAVEPPKSISEMSSEEMDNYATDVRKELRKQDKVFENKTEDEKQKGGYYDVIDNYEDLRDTSTKINFIENSEGLDDLSSSVRSALGNIKDKPTEYDLAILNAAKKKAEELNISTDDLIKQVLKKEGNRYKDANDAEFMMKNALNKIVPSEKQTPLTTSNEGIVEKPLENKQPITKEEFHNNILQMAEGMKDSNFDWRLTIPEMSQKDREKAVADIRAGKDSKQAQKLKAYIDDAYEKNIITLNRGRGNQAQTVEFPLKEWFGEPLTHEELNHAEKIDDATAEIINNEGITSENIDNLKHLFYDKSQFPYNKTDFDNIKDYLARQDKGSAENKSISAQSETENLTNNTDNNAIREQRPTQEIPRTGNAGENITESSSEVRPSEQGNEATGTRSKEEIKNKNEEEVVGVHAEYPPTQLSHLGTEKLRTEFGGEDAPAKERETFLGWEREADEKISEGYDVEGLLDKMENDNHRPTPVEHIILTKQADAYAAKLREIRNINSPEFDKILDKADRLNRLSDVAGSEKGKELVARKFRTVNDDTLLGFLLQEKDLNKGAPLTEQQKITAVNEYERINAATDEFKKKYEDLQEKYSKLLAEREHKKNLASTKKNTKKTPKDYIEERELLIEKLKQQKSDQEKYLQERGIQKAGFGITLTTDMVKTIKDIVKSHVEETAQKLEDVVKAVHAELKDIFEGVTEKDIHDVIAGNYNEKKPKRSEVAERMQNLRIQAQLINRYEALLKGGEPKNERAKIKRNQEINDLREKILGLKKEEAEANKFYGESESGNKRIEKMEDELQRLKERRPKETTEKQQREISGREKELKEQIAEERKKIAAEEKEANTRYKEEIDPKVKALQSLKRRNEAELKKVQEQIKKGDFAPPEKKPILQDEEIRKNFPNAYKEAVTSRDALIKAKRERALRLAKQMYENRTPKEKTAEVIGKALNVPRTLMTIGDFSAVFRQAAVATTAHPIIASKALKFMFEAAADEKVYNRWLDDVHNDPLWETAQKSNLPITDPESLHAREHEEAFYGSQYAEKLPLGVGWTVKASERAYNGYLNFIRWEMFKMYAERFADDGLTIKNSEELYKGISSFIGSATGRGGMSKSLETASPLLNTVLFASRLIAARLNTLGLSDIPNLGVQAARYAVKGATLGKFDPHWGIDFGFYTKLPPKIRIEAAKDMVKFVGVGMATLFLAKQMGADVEDDPRSSDFGKIRSGNTRWDIWGGFQPYARLTAQIITGQSKSTTTGKIYDLNGTKYGGRTTGDQIATFGRGKLSPIFGTALDYFTKRTLDQQTLERRFAAPSFMNNDLQEGHITLTDELIKNVTPLLFNDISDAMKDRGVSSIFTVGIPSLFGIGVQTYAPKTPSNKNGSSIKRPKVQKVQTHKVQGY